MDKPISERWLGGCTCPGDAMTRRVEDLNPDCPLHGRRATDEIARAGRRGAAAGRAARAAISGEVVAEVPDGRATIALLFDVPRSLIFGPERRERTLSLLMGMAA